MHTPTLLLSALALLLGLTPAPIRADEFDPWPTRNRTDNLEQPFRLGLYFQSDDRVLDYGTETLDTRTDQLGLQLAESFTPFFAASVDLGYVGQSQTQNPATEGFNPSGTYLGLGLRATPLQTHYLDLSTAVGYTYFSLEGNTDTQDTQRDWREALLEVEAGLSLQSLRLSAGSRYRHIKGEETALGDVTQNRRFAADQALSGYAGLDILLQAQGRISLRGEGGARQGFYIAFSTGF